MEEISVLIAQAQAGDNGAREVLIEKNLGLVHHIVKRFSGRGYDMEDLFQIGTIGLIKAIDKFDLSFDVRFSTYAVPMISGEIKRFLRDDGLVKVSRTLKENGWKIKQASEKLAHSFGRDATWKRFPKKPGLQEKILLWPWKPMWRWNPFIKPFTSLTAMKYSCWTRLRQAAARQAAWMRKKKSFWTICF